jgi:hypothetical protein
MPWIKGGQLLPICPQPTIRSFTAYMNRFSEVCWMLLRTFPLLQLTRKAFGEKWTDKWRVLDDSFLAMAKGLEELGKPIGAAIIELLDKSFHFCPDVTSYPAE